MYMKKLASVALCAILALCSVFAGVSISMADSMTPPWKDPSIRVNVFDDMNGIPDKLLDIEDAQDVQYASPAAPSGNKLKFENGRLVLYASNNVWSDFRLNYGSAISDCTGAQGNDDTRRI